MASTITTTMSITAGTVTPTKLVSIGSMVRALTIILGVIAAGWGIFVLPGFVADAPLEQTARQIIARVPFSVDALSKLVPSADAAQQEAWCRPSAVRAAAIVKLRLYEDTFSSGEISLLDVRSKDAEEAILTSLICAPSDPFLWMVLLTVKSTRNGFRPEYLDYARMSYRLGPHEGWVALNRAPALLAVFEALPPELAKDVVVDFAQIVDNGFYPEAARMLSGPGWRLRDRLLESLTRIPLVRREQFEQVLAAEAISVAVPGVVPSEQRPYH
jgi:hypothetical protein